ncbi:uncharacterized protein LOC131151385 [Malania oleifera]|uniref:uncharacterized protein LOC131151385 n=1 Tax=Malania oleifera TaxID=397392 RepID=UPI0025AE73C8|nr:uncharacterized protein LOC131151385 [Malania oleifera]
MSIQGQSSIPPPYTSERPPPGVAPFVPAVTTPELGMPSLVVVGTINTTIEHRCDELEKLLRAIEGPQTFNITRPSNYCLVPNVVLPPKFKMPDFEKFDGTTCLRTHMSLFCQSMTAYVDNKTLMIHCFQSNLTGAMARWMTLLEMEKKPTETFREYAHRWRDALIQVDPPVGNQEAIMMFIKTLKDPYSGYLRGATPYDFKDIMAVGSRIEADIRAGLVKDSENETDSSRKWTKKKDEEAHMIQGHYYQDNWNRGVRRNFAAKPTVNQVAYAGTRPALAQQNAQA